MRWLVVAMTVVAAGCYRPAPNEGTPCSALGECPTPLRCEMGVCRAGPADAAGNDDTPPPVDGAIDSASDAPMLDAPTDASPAACTTPPSGTWSTGIAVPVLASPALDGTPEVRSDLLELYFKSERNGTADIWRSTRSSATSPWSTPTLVTELSTTNFDDASPALSPDGLTIYLSSDRPGSAGVNDLWKSTRASLTAPWSMPVRVAELSSTGDEEGLTILPSDRVAYFHSDRGGPYRLYRTTRAAATAPWGAPVEITDIGAGDYENPWVSPDECRIYVQAYRTGTGGAGDLYLVSRTTPTATWGAPVKILPPSSADFDADPWLSPDERIILFTSGGATTNLLDIYVANR